ncbi:transcriptional regulator [Vibrio natriegens]|uniref:winged helix-turn-helix domain-containing protein n=1 Tax=Vibrio natriegens TaxID=691 RepID=UPI00355650E1
MKRREHNVLLNSILVFDSIEGSLTNEKNETIILGGNESRILQLFVRYDNRVITRKEIYQYVWKDRGLEVDDSSLTQAISTLRKNLGDSVKNPEFIKTEPKRGYTFIGKVELIEYSDIFPMHPEENNESEEVRESISASLTKFSAKESLASVDKSLTNFLQRLGGLFAEDRVSDGWDSIVVYSLFLIVISLLLFDFNGSQGMLWYLYKRINLFD